MSDRSSAGSQISYAPQLAQLNQTNHQYLTQSPKKGGCHSLILAAIRAELLNRDGPSGAPKAKRKGAASVKKQKRPGQYDRRLAYAHVVLTLIPDRGESLNGACCSARQIGKLSGSAMPPEPEQGKGVSEIAASIASRLGRSGEGSAVIGDPKQGDASVLDAASGSI